MSGLLALLDDVAAIAKVAAASVDDIAAGAAKAGSKTVGVIIDDAAVTPKYVTGFSAERELPMIWRIAVGSIRNKLFFLLPALMVLNAFYPQFITPLLMLGGLYLCFEGAEKVLHAILPHADKGVEEDYNVGDAAHLEQQKVSGAIKTDFILSAEIMTISLAEIPESTIWIEAITLAIVGTLITVLVYGAVALIVKMDDVGLHLARTGGRLARRFGCALVNFMPSLLWGLSVIGTLAMLWVGGNILSHGLEGLGYPWIYDEIHHIAQAAAEMVPEQISGFVEWLTTAALDGVLGVIVGAITIPIATRVIGPLISAVMGKTSA